MGNSLSTHSFRFYGAQTLISFLGKAFARLRLRRGSPFFVCTMAWGKILTCEDLIKRGSTIEGSCCIFQCSKEIVDHILIHLQ